MPLVRLGSSAAATAGTQAQLDTGDRTLAARARYDQVESSIRSGARRIVLDERDTPLFERFGERVANDFFRRQESPAGLLLVSTFSVGRPSSRSSAPAPTPASCVRSRRSGCCRSRFW